MRNFFLFFFSLLFLFSGMPSNATAKPVLNTEIKNIIINETESENVAAVNTEYSAAKKQLVYVGGTPLGIILKNRGLIIIGKTDIITEYGLKSTVKNSDIQNGDILIDVEGRDVNTADDLASIINEEQFLGKVLKISLKRNGKEINTILEPQLDVNAKKYKAGLWVREETFGIGTLTYIKQNDFGFGALGHPVTDPDTGEALAITGGSVSGCVITGIVKGERGKAGELKGIINKHEICGTINQNNNFGIYGNYTSAYKSIYSEPIQIMPRNDIRPGKAKIITTIDGSSPKEYDIEIIKCLNQAKPSDKNLVIRITDKELLAKTGGILQGMSGSPIIQKGKLCGAVTHVFVNDPTKGYGLSVDWMLQQ